MTRPVVTFPFFAGLAALPVLWWTGGTPVGAVVGFVLAVALALRGRSLITVALVAAAGVWVTELLGTLV